ncbi:glucokinase [Thiolapillus sp.]
MVKQARIFSTSTNTIAEDEALQILAGDIGGTKTTLAFIEASSSQGMQVLCRSTWASREHDSLESILAVFLEKHALRPDAAAFGVAGPVLNGRCITTNLPWTIETAALRRILGIEQLWLINDLEANAWGIDALSDEDFHTLNPGRDNARGNRSIISAGTGLGEAGMYWDGNTHIPFASEGGHASFSPASDLEDALLRYLRSKHGHVSWELVVSGMGLANIHEFLLQHQGKNTQGWLQKSMEEGDVAAAISAAARSGRCELCSQAVELFVHLLGVEAGNHALKIMATGGVYLGGGIAPKILKELQKPAFLQGFFSKGSMETLMRDMPVRVILNPEAALLGAAEYALNRTGRY